MVLEIPVPILNLEIVWLLIGMTFARSFGKKLDYTVQQTQFFKDLNLPLVAWFIKAVLDFTHHWWMGALIWLYAPLIVARLHWPTLHLEVFWFGVGIFIDDIRDFKHVWARYKIEIEEEKPPV